MKPQDQVVSRAHTIVETARKEGRKFLMEYESKKILKIYEIPTTQERLVLNEGEATAMAQEIGFPVVLKICSPNIVHKSDVGGVVVGIETSEEVRKAFRDIMKNANLGRPKAKILGILVQEMVPKGYEVIVGGLRDAQFGPVVMFGLGGVFVELLEDVSFRLYPLSKDEALEMIGETKGFKLLKGFRNEKPADLNALAKAIINVGRIMMDLSEVKEIDINPLIVHDVGVVAADARILLS